MITIALWIILIIIVLTLRPPRHVQEFKNRYKKFITVLPDKYKHLRTPVPLTIFSGNSGQVGYNINKGSEIGICADGTTNQMMHVLLHELAHTTVREYDHSKKFWNNFKELRQIAQDNSLYTPINESSDYCGKHVKD